MAYWNLEALIPHHFMAISEADKIETTDTFEGILYSFHFPYPSDSVNLVAGPYIELRESYMETGLYAYFLSEDISLAEDYLIYTKKYLDLYERLLGPYPYKRFSIVENILPTGYSMPSFTLLGPDVIRLPFIKETSLGHEILHQWLGNCVYVDYESENWVEGVTSYLSDHLYEDQKGEGWQYRKKILTDYKSYVTASKESPLKGFTGRKDFASAAIGYGKGAMVFHMLKNLLGEDIFFDSLRKLIQDKKFTKASWTDLQNAFEVISGEDLEWFFDQWLLRKDIPSPELKDIRVIMLKGIPTISFDVLQEGEPYDLTLPFKIFTENGEVTDALRIEKERETFQIPVEEKPLRIVFDEGYDIMRRLTDKELPPVIAQLLGDGKRLIVYPVREKEKYAELINLFKREGFEAKEEREVRDEDIKTFSLMVLGFESPILKRLFGQIMKPEPGFSLVVERNPLNTEKVLAYANGDFKEEIDPVARKIFHYGKYSLIRFREGENIEKRTEETERGMAFNLYEPVLGIDSKRTVSLTDIIGNVTNKPIIYVGERHSNYEDHKVQLEVIAGLNKKGEKFAIGMEMFQTPFQKALDDYVSDAISEKEFLKESEYFKRWKYDYHLYREIVDFAKAKGIPLIALNLREEIIKKVTEGGLDALTEEEKKEIPQDMDMTDYGYKEKLMEVFSLHKEFHIKNFEYFYQSQILWDETMAHSIAAFMADNPEYQMVVLAGAQHIIYGSGIPQRTYRLNKMEYSTIINGEFDEFTSDIGDFVFFPGPASAPKAPKLGVLLKEKDGNVEIEGFSHESAAQRAGLKKGDVLLSLDEWKIESIADVKIALLDKNQGETIKTKVSRERFPFIKKVLEFDVSL
ncbi:MAG: ChaN family lipoprotein [bacterium]